MKRVKKPKPRKPMGRPRLYAWDKWFAEGRVRFTIIRGRDFALPVPNMIVSIRNHASSVRKVSIRTKVDGNAITVTIVRKNRKKR